MSTWIKKPGAESSPSPPLDAPPPVVVVETNPVTTTSVVSEVAAWPVVVVAPFVPATDVDASTTPGSPSPTPHEPRSRNPKLSTPAPKIVRTRARYHALAHGRADAHQPRHRLRPATGQTLRTRACSLAAALRCPRSPPVRPTGRPVRTRVGSHAETSGAPTMSARRQRGRLRGTPAGRRPALARRRTVGEIRRPVREDSSPHRSPCAEHVRRREPAGGGTHSIAPLRRTRIASPRDSTPKPTHTRHRRATSDAVSRRTAYPRPERWRGSSPTCEWSAPETHAQRG